MCQSKTLATGFCLMLFVATATALLPMRTVYAGELPRPSIPRFAQANVTAYDDSSESMGSIAADVEVLKSQLIRGGELYQSPAGTTTRIALPGAGQVVLMGGAAARLGASTTNFAGQRSRRVLIISLLRGEILVNLDPRAGAYVQAGVNTFSALNGASFRVAFREGRVAVETVGGNVRAMGNWALKVPTQVMDGARERSAFNSISELRSKPLRPINSKPTICPRGIGTIETVHTMTIDGRVTHGRAILHGGEMLEVPVDTTAHVTLNSVAQIVLTGGTEARIETPISRVGGQNGRPLLEATLASGAILVKLDQGGGALIHAGGTTFTAFTGTQFRFGLRDGRVVIDPIGVDALERPARNVSSWTIRPAASVIESASQTAKPRAQSGSRRFVARPLALTTNLSVRARTTRDIESRVTEESNHK